MSVINSHRNISALLALFFLFSACGPQGPQKAKPNPAGIAAIENEYYIRGDLNKAFALASAAYQQNKALKQQTQALLWMAKIKLGQGDYKTASLWLNRAKPGIAGLKNDSLTVTAYLLKGRLFAAGILPDSAKWCFQQAEKQIAAKLPGSRALTFNLALDRMALYEQLHQATKVDSLSSRVLNSPGIKTDQKGYYYALALVGRIQFFNDNGSPDSALRLSDILKSNVKQVFPQSNYLSVLLYRSLSRSALNNVDYNATLEYAAREMEYAHKCASQGALFYAYLDLEEAYISNQDFKKAIDYADSTDLVRTNNFPDRSAEANIVNTSYIRIYANTHNYNRAKYYAQKSISLNSVIFGKNSVELAKAYALMGDIYSYRQQYDSVLYYNQKVLAIRKAIYPKGHLQIAFCMDDIARTYNNMDKPIPALPYQQEVERIYKKNYGPTHSYIAWAYDAEADSYGQLHQYDKAILYNDKALELFIPGMSKDTDAITRTSEIPFDIYIPDYMTSRVQLFVNRGINEKDKRKKIRYMQEAYRLSNAEDKYIQSYTRHFDSPESVSVVYQRMNEYYKLCTDISYRLYMLTGDERYRNSILNYSENKRGAFLRSNILNSKSIQFSGVPAPVIKEEADIRNAVTAAAGKSIPARVKDSVNKVYEKFLVRLSAHYSNYYKLKYLPYELNEKQVQQWLPNDSTAFAEYIFSKERIYILVITKKKCAVIGLDQKDQVVAQISGLNQLLKKADAKSYYEKAYQVYSNLVQPIEQYIKPGSRIIISADGPLSTLSFEALPTKPRPAGNGFNAGDFLLNKYNFSYAVSAFSLLNPFDNGAAIKEKSRAYFSAPGFDDRLKNDYRQYAANHQLLVDHNYLSYLYQPFMMKLGDALADTWKVTKEEGGNATESDFKEKASGNNIVQVGSHAILNDIDPMRSCLVFAKELTEDKNTNDGYLYSSEIYNQKINADLVILTACETGGGQYKEGEGMMSLSYSFEYAGCKSAIMSLWPIDEKTASAITEKFYNHLSAGESTSEALYHAKKDFLNTADAGLVNPFYWSGLVLLGQNEKIQLEKKGNAEKYAWLIGALGVAAIAVVGVKKWKNKQAA